MFTMIPVSRNLCSFVRTPHIFQNQIVLAPYRFLFCTARDVFSTFVVLIKNLSMVKRLIKALTATAWGKQETLMVPIRQSRDRLWSIHLASSTSINKLQVMQNSALRTATGCTQDTNIQHLHNEILILPIHNHLQLHESQYKQKTQHSSHHLHKHTSTLKDKTNSIFSMVHTEDQLSLIFPCLKYNFH